jgi:predicted ester cyclase
MSTTSDQTTAQANKAIVRRFNEEVIEQGREESFRALMAPHFINRTAAPGMPPGPEGMAYMFEKVLRPAFPDLRVQIHDQIAEGDRVTTRKTIHGTHRGELMGIAPTHRPVAIEVIDIVRIEHGRYAEHWGVTTLPAVLTQLQEKQDSSRHDGGLVRGGHEGMSPPEVVG